MGKDLYIHREIETCIHGFLKQFPCLALTGPRQSGKTTLLRNLFAKNRRFVSFDDPLIRQRAVSDPNLFLQEIEKGAVLDEIQYASEFLSYIKIAVDKNRSLRGRFIITGSQQFNLIKGLGDSLAGRIGILTLLPFSWQEKRHIPYLKGKVFTVVNSFVDNCLRGAFPEISVHPKMDSQAWYGSYLQTYLERDIRAIYNVGSLREFQKFMQLLAARCSQVLNLNSLSGELGVAVNTVKKWISILEASQIIYLLSPYYQNLGKRITKNPKVYFLDCGLVCYLTGIRDKKYLLNGPMAGSLFENYVIQEVVKACCNRGRRPNIFYLRTHNEIEVDLIIERNLEIFPVEIKLNKSPNREMAKPMERFKKIFSMLKIMPGRLISLSEEDIRLSHDVSVEPLERFLKWVGNG